MRDGVSKGSKTTRTSADTLFNPLDYMSYPHHQIAIRELGGAESLSYFIYYMGHVSELRPEEGTGWEMLEIKTLIIGRQIDPNPAISQGIEGTLLGRLAKLLMYGQHRKSEIELEVGGNQKFFDGFRKMR